MLASKSLAASSRLSNYCRRLVYRQRALGKLIPVRTCSSTVLPPPQTEGAEKQYPPKIQKIVEDISGLNLLEVADLNELLKENAYKSPKEDVYSIDLKPLQKTLNISETPMMAMGGAVAQAPKEEEEEDVAPKREKMAFSVKLIKIDDGKKIQLIKQIKGLIAGMNLVQAKKFVESVPQVVKADIPKDEAEKLKEALVAAGGEVEID